MLYKWASVECIRIVHMHQQLSTSLSDIEKFHNCLLTMLYSLIHLSAFSSTSHQFTVHVPELLVVSCSMLYLYCSSEMGHFGGFPSVLYFNFTFRWSLMVSYCSSLWSLISQISSIRTIFFLLYLYIEKFFSDVLYEFRLIYCYVLLISSGFPARAYKWASAL